MDTFLFALAGFSAGLFFILSGYHKLTNESRRATFREELAQDVPVPSTLLPYLGYWVAGWEFSGGALVAFGPWIPVPAFVLGVVAVLTILAIACCTAARRTVASYHVIDIGDLVDDWLYQPEILLAILVIVSLGNLQAV